MDAPITAAARALGRGDPLGALKHVALRDDAHALALRGIAMAQLGDPARAKHLLQRAVRAFGPREPAARARCVVAAAEIALASRDLGGSAKRARCRASEARGARRPRERRSRRLLEIRRLLLTGRIEEAERSSPGSTPRPCLPRRGPPASSPSRGIAIRRLRTKTARAALVRAERAASHAGIPRWRPEVESAFRILETPAARRITNGAERGLLLGEVESLLASRSVVVDACRRAVRRGSRLVPLARRPVLFALARALAEAWPKDVARDELVARAFEWGTADDSYRLRLRVELARLRRQLRDIAGVTATKRGFVLARTARARWS
jgi:hypothetical protein